MDKILLNTTRARNFINCEGLDSAQHKFFWLLWDSQLGRYRGYAHVI